MRNDVIFTAGRQEHEADSCCFAGVPVIVIIVFILGEQDSWSVSGKMSLTNSQILLDLLQVTLPHYQVLYLEINSGLEVLATSLAEKQPELLASSVPFQPGVRLLALH